MVIWEQVFRLESLKAAAQDDTSARVIQDTNLPPEPEARLRLESIEMTGRPTHESGGPLGQFESTEKQNGQSSTAKMAQPSQSKSWGALMSMPTRS